MGVSIYFHPKAHSFLEKLDSTLQKQIKEKIRELKEKPQLGKHLRYYNFWRLRIQDYRIIYEIQDTEERIIILYIGHRKNIYDKISKFY